MSLSQNPGENFDIANFQSELDREIKLIFLARDLNEGSLAMDRTAQLIADAYLATRGDTVSQSVLGASVNEVFATQPGKMVSSYQAVVWSEVASKLANS
ncbi:MAG: hypothetical protein AAB606_03050 [Patescibacteria group bacterium]